jgi:WD40-like Beta Propeller Repeat
MGDLKARFRDANRIGAPDLWSDIVAREPRLDDVDTARTHKALVVIVAIAVAAAGIGFAVAALRPSNETRPIEPGPEAANGAIAYVPIATQHVFWTIAPTGGTPTETHVDVPGFVGVPSWSPDGTRIVFSVQSYADPHPEGGNWDIYVANADGTDATRLTTEAVDHGPAWSPDGTQIAYVRGWDHQQIWVMNADGSDPHQLTAGDGSHIRPAWSPDGARIAFIGWDGTNSDVYVMNADGSDVRRLTNDAAAEDNPSWSPDGRRIAFTSEGGGRDPGVYTMSPDGQDVTELTRDPDPANLGIAWSPDGRKIALVSIRGPGNDRNVYILDVETGTLSAIGTPGAYVGVSWQPAIPVTPSPEPSASPFVTTVDHVIQIEPSPGFVSAVAVGFGSAWVAGQDASGDARIVRLDERTGERTAVISTPVVPSWETGGGGLAIGDGSVWVIGGAPSRLLRIDPSTNSVAAALDLPGRLGADVVVAPFGVWTLSFGLHGRDGMAVAKIDPSTNTVVASTELYDVYGHYILSVGGSIVVATNQTHGSTVGDTVLNFLDPTTATVTRRVDLRSYVAIGAGDVGTGLWMVSAGRLSELDPATGDVVENWTARATGDAVAVGDGGVWYIDVRNRDAVDRFDPSSAASEDVVRLPAGTTPVAIAVGADSVWVLNYGGSVTRVGNPMH